MNRLRVPFLGRRRRGRRRLGLHQRPRPGAAGHLRHRHLRRPRGAGGADRHPQPRLQRRQGSPGCRGGQEGRPRPGGELHHGPDLPRRGGGRRRHGPERVRGGRAVLGQPSYWPCSGRDGLGPEPGRPLRRADPDRHQRRRRHRADPDPGQRRHRRAEGYRRRQAPPQGHRPGRVCRQLGPRPGDRSYGRQHRLQGRSSSSRPPSSAPSCWGWPSSSCWSRSAPSSSRSKRSSSTRCPWAPPTACWCSCSRRAGCWRRLLGFEATGIIESWLPLFLFSILFGLSMDYHMFIMSRIKEAYERGRAARRRLPSASRRRRERSPARPRSWWRWLHVFAFTRDYRYQAVRLRAGHRHLHRRDGDPLDPPAGQHEAPGRMELVPARLAGVAAQDQLG